MSISATSPREWPVTGFLESHQAGLEEFWTLKVPLDRLQFTTPSSASHFHLEQTNSRLITPRKTPKAFVINGRSTTSDINPLPQTRQSKFTEEEDLLLVDLIETERLPWSQIKSHFPARRLRWLQVHYFTKLKKGNSGLKKQSSRKDQRSCVQTWPVYLSKQVETDSRPFLTGAETETQHLRCSERYRRLTARAESSLALCTYPSAR